MRKGILVLILFIQSVLYSQKPIVEASIDTASIKIGEQISYKITIHNQENIVFPDLELIGSLELVRSTNKVKFKNSLVKEYIITSFDSGSFTIPRQKIDIKGIKFFTDSILVKVSDIKIDTLKQAMHGIKKSIIRQKYVFDDFVPYMTWGIPLLVLLICYLLFLKYYNKPKKKKIIPSIPPFEQAKDSLEKLDSKQYLANENYKDYYVELTEILRLYIERKYNIPALESTTDELLSMIEDFKKMKTLDISDYNQKELAVFLKESDLIKFAKSIPDKYRSESERKLTEKIIIELETVKKTEEIYEME